MLRMRHAALAATALCGLLAAGAARADVIYTLDGAAPGQMNNFRMALDFTDAQVASGAFSLQGSGVGGTGNPTPDYRSGLRGDVNGFNTLYFGGETVPTERYFGITADIAFGPDDSLSSVSINYQGNGADALISGTGASSTITYLDDATQICNQPRGCTYSAAWSITSTDPTGVPEPATFAVLGAGCSGWLACVAGLEGRGASCAPTLAR